MVDLCYQDESGSLYTGDSLAQLKTIDEETVDLVFADPSYNIKKAAWDCFDSQDQYIEWTAKWVYEAAKTLKPSGTLMICGFTEILADIKHVVMPDFQACKWLIWFYRNKANLSNDWGRSHEIILVLRKSKKCFNDEH